jgi:hypothetical protein
VDSQKKTLDIDGKSDLGSECGCVNTVVHYIRNRVPFGTHCVFSLECVCSMYTVFVVHIVRSLQFVSLCIVCSSVIQTITLNLFKTMFSNTDVYVFFRRV